MIDTVSTLFVLVGGLLLTASGTGLLLVALRERRLRRLSPAKRAMLNWSRGVRELRRDYATGSITLAELESRAYDIAIQYDKELGAGESEAGLLVAALNEREGIEPPAQRTGVVTYMDAGVMVTRSARDPNVFCVECGCEKQIGGEQIYATGCSMCAKRVEAA